MEKPKIQRFCEVIEKWTLNVTMVICAFMLVVAWMHVIRRYAFNSALTWSEEFLRFSIVWYALLSASILHKRNAHLGITIFREMMPQPVQTFLRRILIYLATAVAGEALKDFARIEVARATSPSVLATPAEARVRRA